MCSIYSAPYRLSSTYFGRQIPSTVVNLPTKFCDDRAKGLGQSFLSPSLCENTMVRGGHVLLIYSRNVSARPPKLYPKFGVDRVNLSKVLFI